MRAASPQSLPSAKIKTAETDNTEIFTHNKGSTISLWAGEIAIKEIYD